MSAAITWPLKHKSSRDRDADGERERPRCTGTPESDPSVSVLVQMKNGKMVCLDEDANLTEECTAPTL